MRPYEVDAPSSPYRVLVPVRPSGAGLHRADQLPAPAPVAGARLTMSLGVLIAVPLLALNLRPAVTSVGAMLTDIQAGTGMSAVLASAVVAAPVWCFAVGGGLAWAMRSRFGTSRTVSVALAALAGTLAARVMGDSYLLLAGTVVACLAIAVLGTLLPVVTHAAPKRAWALLTGCYVAAMGGGSGIGALVTPEVADRSSWQLGVSGWALLAAAAWAAWRVASRKFAEPVVKAQKHPGPSTLRPQGTAWALTFHFGLTSGFTFSMMGWLPSILLEWGNVPPARVQWMFTVAMALGVPLALLVPKWARATASQSGLAVVLAAPSLVATLGLLMYPAWSPWMWSVGLGLGMPAIGLALAMISLRAAPDGDTAAALSSMVQGVGYAIAGATALACGLLHSWATSWEWPLLGLTLVLCGQIITGMYAGLPVVIRAGGRPEPPPAPARAALPAALPTPTPTPSFPMSPPTGIPVQRPPSRGVATPGHGIPIPRHVGSIPVRHAGASRPADSRPPVPSGSAALISARSTVPTGARVSPVPPDASRDGGPEVRPDAPRDGGSSVRSGGPGSPDVPAPRDGGLSVRSGGPVFRDGGPPVRQGAPAPRDGGPEVRSGVLGAPDAPRDGGSSARSGGAAQASAGRPGLGVPTDPGGRPAPGGDGPAPRSGVPARPPFPHPAPPRGGAAPTGRPVPNPDRRSGDLTSDTGSRAGGRAGAPMHGSRRGPMPNPMYGPYWPPIHRPIPPDATYAAPMQPAEPKQGPWRDPVPDSPAPHIPEPRRPLDDDSAFAETSTTDVLIPRPRTAEPPDAPVTEALRPHPKPRMQVPEDTPVTEVLRPGPKPTDPSATEVVVPRPRVRERQPEPMPTDATATEVVVPKPRPRAPEPRPTDASATEVVVPRPRRQQPEPSPTDASATEVVVPRPRARAPEPSPTDLSATEVVVPRPRGQEPSPTDASATEVVVPKPRAREPEPRPTDATVTEVVVPKPRVREPEPKPTDASATEVVVPQPRTREPEAKPTAATATEVPKPRAGEPDETPGTDVLRQPKERAVAQPSPTTSLMPPARPRKAAKSGKKTKKKETGDPPLQWVPDSAKPVQLEFALMVEHIVPEGRDETTHIPYPRRPGS